MSVLDELIHRADLDELVRHVERTVAARDWEHLVRTRDAAGAAVSTGRQLWPIATLANFRLALRAPAEHAVRALDDGARTFMPGPVSEILASAHQWRDLAPHLPPGHDRSLTAYERAMRGDRDLCAPGLADREERVLDIPVVPAAWEPVYRTATYDDDDGVRDDPPESPAGVGATVQDPDVTGDAAAPDIDSDRAVTDAFRQLVEPWTAASNGTARVSFVDGSAADALAAIGIGRPRLVPIVATEALSWLAWAGASGGAHGRRRGAATGRFGAWWLLAAITGLDDGGWPPEPEEFAGALEELRFWWWFDDDTGHAGWRLQLVVDDLAEETSCAMQALDRAQAPGVSGT